MKTMKWMIGLVLALWALGGRAQQAAPGIEVAVGSGVVIETPAGASRVALADDTVAKVTVLNGRELLLQGLSNGRTTLFVWKEDGRRDEYVVRVRRDWAAVQTAVTAVAPGAEVAESADGYTLLLKGRVADKAAAVMVQARAAEVLATMPDPKPGVVNLLEYTDQNPLAEMDRALFEALQAIDGRIMLRRIHAPKRLEKNPEKPEQMIEVGGDSYVLEGRVRTIRDLSKAMYLADRQMGGTGGRIQAADETKIRSQRRQSFGTDFGGGNNRGGGNRLDNELIPNGLAAQVARGLVLSSESGRVISFLEVDNLQQILVGIRVLEVDRQKARSLGMNYSVVGKDFAASVRHVPGTVTSTAGGTLGGGLGDLSGNTGRLVGAEQGGNIVGAFVSDSLAVLAAIDLMQEKAVARSVAEPNVLTLTGEEATVVVGGEVPVPTTAVGQVAAVQGYEFQTFGVRLAIRPTLTADGVVTLEVAPSIVRPVPGLGSEDVPGFQVQTVQTTARVKAGESLLIGGLISFEETVEERGIPLLSRIPVLGWLFKWEKKVRAEKELVFVMTPRLVDEEGIKRAVILPGLESRDHSIDRQLTPQHLEPDGLPEIWANPEPKYPPMPCPPRKAEEPPESAPAIEKKPSEPLPPPGPPDHHLRRRVESMGENAPPGPNRTGAGA